MTRRKGLTDPRRDVVDANAVNITKADRYGQALMEWRPGGGVVATVGSDDAAIDVTKADPTVAPTSRQIQDPFDGMYGNGNAIMPPLDPYKMLQLPENNAIHSACVLAKSADSVGRGWLWDPTDKDADMTIPDKLDEMLEAITPGLSFSELLRQAVWEKEAIGWSGWEVARAGDYDIYLGKGEPVNALFPMPAHTIRATKDPNVWVQIKNVEVRYFKVFGCTKPYDAITGKVATDEQLAAYLGGNKSRFEPAREIIVFRTYTPRTPYYGIPAWIGAMPAMAELQAIREFNISFFASGGTVDRIIHVKSDSDETAKPIADKIHETIRSAAGRGHVTVITYGNPQTEIKVEPMNGPTGAVGGRDAQFVKRRDDLIKEVLMAHNVPPYRIGLAELGSLGGSAAKEMLRSYKVGAIESEQQLLEDRLNHTLFGPEGFNVQGFQWKLESLDWDETELNLSIATQGVNAGILTRNEGRDLIGQERFEDPAMDKTTSSTAINPVTTGEEAAGFKGLIGEWKTALEAVIRGDPPPPPPGAVPGAPGAPAVAAPAALPPGAKKPAAPAAAPATKAEVMEAIQKVEDRLAGRIEDALTVERIEKGDEAPDTSSELVEALERAVERAEKAEATAEDGRAGMRDYVTQLAEHAGAAAAEAATAAVERAMAGREADITEKQERISEAIAKLAEVAHELRPVGKRAERADALLESVNQLLLMP